jgi:hypothetical protein
VSQSARARTHPRAVTVALYVILVALCVPLGTLWHEIMGHALAGCLARGKVTFVEVLGFELYPRLCWIGWQGHYGCCGVEDLPSAKAEHVVWLAGSMSTWLVSVAATIVLYVRRWRGLWRAVVVCASLWWIDLATYMLPVFGFRRSLIWGGYFSEPYEAAVGLGIPGPVFLTFALGSSAALAGALLVRLVKDRPPRARGVLRPRPR